ncbi:hypothetical protein CDAR_99061 [Caerostris darwini]|uniref:Uncharacterized protein n=1 Tax=Caerostris darwini TaxID=1538125 RepID=A0AAV4Q769_9ARAC|nr:hypothetical protein CDAR_99061 [Caerostris darwini]
MRPPQFNSIRRRVQWSYVGRPESSVVNAVRAINLPDYDGLSPSSGYCFGHVGWLLSYRTGWSVIKQWRVARFGLNAAVFSNGMDRFIFCCNRLFIAEELRR